jgi:hypothetical protein
MDTRTWLVFSGALLLGLVISAIPGILKAKGEGIDYVLEVLQTVVANATTLGFCRIEII